MMEISTSSLDKKPIISESERKYGTGDNAKMHFAFRLIPICIIAMCVSIAAVLATHFLLLNFTGNGLELLPVLGFVVPTFSMPLTFMLGYLYGKPAEK